MSIGADIADLRSKMDTATGTVQSGVSKINSAVDAMKATAAFGALTAMFGEVAAAADEIDTISGRISDTAENVQKLQAVSKVMDVEIGAVVAGIQEMQARLGDGKLEAALGNVGVKVAEFKALSPADQFLTAADALSKIEDPALRGAAAADIFGKNAKGLAGAFRDGVKDVDAWVAMSDRTVGNIDRIKTWFGLAKDSVVAFSANVITNIALLDQYQRVAEFFSKELPTAPAAPAGPAGLPVMGLPDDYAKINESLGASAEASIKLQKSQEKTAEAAKKAAESFRESVTYIDITQRGYVTIAQAVEDAASDIAEVRESTQAVADISFNDTWTPFLEGAKDAGDLAEDVRRKMATLASWREVGQKLSGAIIGAIQGGGDVGQALGSTAGQMLGTKLGTSIGDWAGKAVGGAMGAAIGGAAGSVLPVVGTMLGSVAGSAIGKLFGGGEGKQVNDMRDQFVSAAGGINELNIKAQAAGMTLDHLLSAKKVKDFNAAVAELNGAFNEQEQLQQRGIAAMERYGITIDEAGSKFKQTQMNATAEELVKDFQGLVHVGVGVDTIIGKMGGSVGEFVQRSIEMGTSVPRELQGIIAKMIEQGTLLDANGEKFTDISQIPFADSINEGLAKLIDKLDIMLDKIGVQLPGAIGRVPREVDITFRGRYDGPNDFGVPAMAEGGIVRRPTFALIGEAGPEAVVPLHKMGALGGGGGNVTIVLNNAVLEGYASEQRFVRRILDALQAEGDRRGMRTAFAGA